jgi:ChrR Cupin-like domain
MDTDPTGRTRGAQWIIETLNKHKVRYGNEVITSRDKRVIAVQKDLKRTGMPPGVEQWLIPMVFHPAGEVLSFTGRMRKNAKVPPHSHKFGVARIIIKGSLKYGRVTLKVGDWMFVPAGVDYAVTAGPDGCSTLYHHAPCLPWLTQQVGRVTRSVSRSAPR